MNHIQWAFMAESFRRKEEEEAKRQDRLITAVYTAALRSMRELLIHLFGLNIGLGKAVEGEPTPYYPFVSLVARPEVLQELLKRESDSKHEQEALESLNLNDVNEGLMKLDLGDLEPVFSGQNSDDPFERWKAEPNIDLLKAMGVELHEGELDLTKEV